MPDRVDDGLRLGQRVRTHARLGVEPADPEGYDAQRGEVGEAIEDPSHRVVEDRAVVQAGAHDDLAVHLDAVVEQGSQPAQAGGAPPVSQHLHAHLGVGGVDRHVERAQPLGHHPLEVRLGEAGERREVPVEEAQPVVVVLQVEALPQARWQLVDEAELAVVVAGAHLVEQGRVHLQPERLARRLGHLDRALQAPTGEVEHGVGVVDQEAPLDDVAGHLAVDGDHLVADLHPGTRRRRAWRHSDHTGKGHRSRLRRRPRVPAVRAAGTGR